MNDSETVLDLKDYGKIQIFLKKQLDDRNMTRNQLARAINSRFEVVDKWCNGKIEKIDVDILARICFVLKCKVSDIVEYTDK